MDVFHGSFLVLPGTCCVSMSVAMPLQSEKKVGTDVFVVITPVCTKQRGSWAFIGKFVVIVGSTSALSAPPHTLAPPHLFAALYKPLLSVATDWTTQYS